MPEVFKRGLDPKWLDSVSNFLNSGPGKLLSEYKDSEGHSYQICIRDNYINIYWKGCSIVKYNPKARKYFYKTHMKYLGQDSGSYAKLEMRDNDLKYKQLSFMNDILSNPNRATKGYVVGEKEATVDYIRNREPEPFLLDLEVAFRREREPNEITETGRKFVADRIDLAEIIILDGKLYLQLVEIKLDSNSEIRAMNQKPKVLSQMKKYKDFIKRERKALRESYRTIAENYIELDLTHKFPTLNGVKAKEILEDFSKNGEIWDEPLLLVVGSKENMRAQKKVGIANHWTVLSEKLGDNVKGHPEANFE